ncbi:MAG: ABC transporter permease [Lachnospiraceae bacterium]|nr:ABC transporter permease [Lachnospiraceae bacterium]
MAAACAFLMLVPANLYHTLDWPEFVTYMGIGDAGLRMDIRQTDDIAGVTARTAEQLAGDADVEKYVVLKTRSYSMGLPDGSTSALTVEEGDHNVFPVRYEKGEAPKGKGQIALSALNAKETGLTVGDSLSLNTEKGAERYTVCGIYSDITNGGKTAKACRIADEKAPVMWSVFYVSLKDHVSEKTWINKYQQPEIKVTDIADYVKGTYGQTLKEIRLAAVVATGISAGILFVVTALFLRLTIEKNRYAISLKKAIGFCSRDIKRSYRIRGFLPAFFGIVTGIFLGNTCGEKLCGSMLTSFGAEGFSFVTDWRMVCFLIPVTLSFAAAAAVEAGKWEIRNIRAFECCIGKE